MRYIAVNKVDNNILIKGDSCCINLEELYRALVDRSTTEIVITKEFADRYFTYTALCDFVEHSAAIAPDVRIVVNDTVVDLTVDAVKNLKIMKSPAQLIYALEHNPTKVLSTIQTLCDKYLDVHTEASVANSKIATMMVQIDDLQKQLGYKDIDYNKLMSMKNDLQAKFDALVSRVNFRYERVVDPDKMFIATENSYNHILYVKEITRVHYTDNLLYYITEILKTTYSTPVRMVVIEPYYAYSSQSRYKGFKPHWDLTYRDVYSGNVLMAGYQPKVMGDILQNPNHVNFLIVLDRGGYSYPHLDCGNTTVVYTVSDLKDLPAIIDKSKVISYDESTMFIPYIEGFDDLSPELKVQKYSSMNVTKELIRFLEEVNDV